MRTAVVAALAGVLGAVAAVGLGSAAGWIGDTETIVVGGGPADTGDAEHAAAPATAKPLVGNAFEPAKLFAARSTGVVTLYAFFGEGAAGASQGSGFVVSDSGLILTNSHVVTSAGEVEDVDDVRKARVVYVRFDDGDRIDGEVVGFDPYTDVAVVRVDPGDHDLTPVPLGDSSRVTVGEPVAAIGSPFGNASSLAVGVVSATGRSISSLTSPYNVVDAIQTDAPINRGNSGGPLFDARGRVIGINAQIRTDTGANEGVGFAIPINAARRSLEQLVEDGEVSYAYVGVRTTDLTPSIAERFGYPVGHGAAISTISANSPAARAGLRASTREEQFNGLNFPLGGDVIVAINGDPVRSADDLVRYVSERLEPDSVAVFTVVRDGARRRVPVKLGER